MISDKQNIVARDAVLASIRSSLAASEPFDAQHQKHHASTLSFQHQSRRESATPELIESFKTNLESVGGICAVVPSENEAAKYIENLVETIRAKAVATSDSDLVNRVTKRVKVCQHSSKEVLFDCDLGITSAQAAIAETGTLVLQSEAERHRLVSLVPPIHLCVLRADVIRETLGEILELAGKNLSRTITFITGASRTSDIELTLAIGVHGPKELHVVVISDQ